MSKVYEIVTEQILEQLEQGVVPWSRPWKVDALAWANLATGRAYRGGQLPPARVPGRLDAVVANLPPGEGAGGRILRGAKSAPVVFWRWAEKKDPKISEEIVGEDGTAERLPVLRYYRVFNLEQAEGIPESRIPEICGGTVEQVAEAERIISGFPSPPTIEHRAQRRACYAPASDTVTMPPREVVDSTTGYYSTLIHELAHSTGHARRLGRPSFERNHAALFGSDD